MKVPSVQQKYHTPCGDPDKDPLFDVLYAMKCLLATLVSIMRSSQGCAHTLVHSCVCGIEADLHPKYKTVMRYSREYLARNDVVLDEDKFAKVIELNNAIQTSVNNMLRAHVEILRAPREFCKFHPEEGHVTRLQVEASQDALRHLMFALLQLPKNMMARIMQKGR